MSLFPIVITPATVLATVLAVGGIAGLVTAGIIGAQKNRRRTLAVDIETVDPDMPGSWAELAQIDGEIAGLEHAEQRGSSLFDRPIFATLFGGSQRFAGGPVSTAMHTERTVGFHPELAMPYGEAAKLREDYREAHPDVYAAMAAHLFPADDVQLKPLKQPIPAGVYWRIDAQNFYGPDGRAMDQAFAEAWWPRMTEFPQR